ncbi:hypothetical protein CC85DRAFT_300185 [Cutaneotrichosporon oleaginosum]|uniref:Uncharacterized protein n=1 Tax=Cutaneotrichosporon oleaginosum TaxID=879819 RepID=A0A0J1B9U6_9TREE|nr:uncharacterized protein CC85DRAFT_300185 [Cutaneotrichosporon oleaginosum]KLT44634.1 hypothetical protein CC85DRAFT_300185 [Cutaneotrichosporon oleaginosum]TXT07620.1 hypothetical protein COLE_04544 [Cutaneotrichosporon oleaginosum]
MPGAPFAWDDYVNYQLGPALLYADQPLGLDAPPPSPQGSVTGMFPHRAELGVLRLHKSAPQRVMPEAPHNPSEAAAGPSRRSPHSESRGMDYPTAEAPSETSTLTPPVKHPPLLRGDDVSAASLGGALDPTSCSRLARRSTLTLTLSHGASHRVRVWRSSPIPPLVVRLASAPRTSNLTPTPAPAPHESPRLWEEHNDPYAHVRERISICQDRITEHDWVLAYGGAALEQSRHSGRSFAARGGPGACTRRFSFGGERNTLGWQRQSARANKRIEHFQHLQEHYLGLMGADNGRRGTACAGV